MRSSDSIVYTTYCHIAHIPLCKDIHPYLSRVFCNLRFWIMKQSKIIVFYHKVWIIETKIKKTEQGGKKPILSRFGTDLAKMT